MAFKQSNNPLSRKTSPMRRSPFRQQSQSMSMDDLKKLSAKQDIASQAQADQLPQIEKPGADYEMDTDMDYAGGERGADYDEEGMNDDGMSRMESENQEAVYFGLGKDDGTGRKTRKANKTADQIAKMQNKRSSYKKTYLGDPDDLEGEMIRTADKPASKREVRKIKKYTKTKNQLDSQPVKKKGLSRKSSPLNATMAEAYKNRDMKTYGDLSLEDYTTEANRQIKSKNEGKGYDAPSTQMESKKDPEPKSKPVVDPFDEVEAMDDKDATVVKSYKKAKTDQDVKKNKMDRKSDKDLDKSSIRLAKTKDKISVAKANASKNSSTEGGTIESQKRARSKVKRLEKRANRQTERQERKDTRKSGKSKEDKRTDIKASRERQKENKTKINDPSNPTANTAEGVSRKASPLNNEGHAKPGKAHSHYKTKKHPDGQVPKASPQGMKIKNNKS